MNQNSEITQWKESIESNDLEKVKKLFDSLKTQYQNWGLNRASRLGFIEIVKFLVEEKLVDVNFLSQGSPQAFEEFSSPAFEACSNGKIEILKYLHSKGADDLITINDCTCLLIATKGGHLECIKFLIENCGAKSQINQQDRDGVTPILTAIANNKLEIVKYLYSQGADFSIATNKGTSCLISASRLRYLECLKFLVETCGANYQINQPNKSGTSPVLFACKSGNLEVLKYLYSKGADISIKDTEGLGCLHWALESITSNTIHSECVKFLIETCGAKSQINQVDKRGLSPIHIAVLRGNLEILKYFHSKGADLSIIDREKSTLLLNASLNDYLECVKFLIEKCGARSQINQQNKDRKVPIHFAVKHNNFEMFKFLVENGADFEIPDSEEKTCVLLACEAENFEILKYLNWLGADFDVQSRRDDTCHRIVARVGNLEILKFLIENGHEPHEPNEKTYVCVEAAKGGQLEVLKYLFETLGYEFPRRGRNEQPDGMTLLMYAVDAYKIDEEKRLEVVKYLVEIALDELDEVDERGRTAFWIACYQGHLKLVKYFHSIGESSEKTDWKRSTSPFMIAVERDQVEVMKYLVSIEFDRKKRDSQGKTALFTACTNSDLTLVEFLIKVGFNIDEEDDDGRTAFSIAFCEGDLEVAKFLLDNGCNRGTHEFEIETDEQREILEYLKSLKAETEHQREILEYWKSREPEKLNEEEEEEKQQESDDQEPEETKAKRQKIQ